MVVLRTPAASRADPPVLHLGRNPRAGPQTRTFAFGVKLGRSSIHGPHGDMRGILAPSLPLGWPSALKIRDEFAAEEAVSAATSVATRRSPVAFASGLTVANLDPSEMTSSRLSLALG